MSQQDGKPKGSEDAYATGLAIRHEMFGPDGAERQIEAATDFTRPLQDMVEKSEIVMGAIAVALQSGQAERDVPVDGVGRLFQRAGIVRTGALELPQLDAKHAGISMQARIVGARGNGVLADGERLVWPSIIIEHLHRTDDGIHVLAALRERREQHIAKCR